MAQAYYPEDFRAFPEMIRQAVERWFEADPDLPDLSTVRGFTIYHDGVVAETFLLNGEGHRYFDKLRHEVATECKFYPSRPPSLVVMHTGVGHPDDRVSSDV